MGKINQAKTHVMLLETVSNQKKMLAMMEKLLASQATHKNTHANQEKIATNQEKTHAMLSGTTSNQKKMLTTLEKLLANQYRVLDNQTKSEPGQAMAHRNQTAILAAQTRQGQLPKPMKATTKT